MLHRSESILLIAPHGDCAVGARNLEDIEAMMRCCHKPCQGWVAENGIVWQRNVGDVEVEALGL
jgi:hypothetical protein